MGDNLNGIFANMIQGMGFIGCNKNGWYDPHSIFLCAGVDGVSSG